MRSLRLPERLPSFFEASDSDDEAIEASTKNNESHELCNECISQSTVCSGCAHPSSNPLVTAITAQALSPPVAKRSDEGNRGKQSSDLDESGIANRNTGPLHMSAMRTLKNEHVLSDDRDCAQRKPGDDANRKSNNEANRKSGSNANRKSGNKANRKSSSNANRNSSSGTRQRCTAPRYKIGISARGRQQKYLDTLRIEKRAPESDVGRQSDNRPEILAIVSSKDELLEFDEDKDFIVYEDNPFLEPLPRNPKIQ